MVHEADDLDVDRLVAEYREATRRRDVLLAEASTLGDRLGHLAQALSARPERLVIGSTDAGAEPYGEDVVPGQPPLPTLAQVAALTEEIRTARARVEALGERLILKGHGDVIEPADGFFR